MSLAIIASSGADLAARQNPGNWHQWRGAHRDGVGDAAALPNQLPETLTRVWHVPVGTGHSSPIFVGDTVFLHSREGDQEVARALSLVDGSELWRQGYDAPYTMNPAARSHGPGPKSTPVYADGRLFTFGITEVLSAFDAQTGASLWRREFSGEYPETAPIYGSAMSPIVVGDLLVAHVGWDRAGALTAFDVATGETRWRNDEFTPGYASPILVDVGGTPTLVSQGDKHIFVVRAEDGRTMWSMPFETAYQQNSVTPLAAGEGVILSGLDEGLFMMRLQSTPGVIMGAGSAPATGGPGRSKVREVQAWAATEAWRNDSLPLYMSSPVVLAGRVFAMSHKRAGQFVCVDAGTGEPIWASRGREGENAAIVVLGDRVAFLTDLARLVIIDAGAAAYEPLAEYQVADTPTWAHPAFTPRGVLIKDLETLALWGF